MVERLRARLPELLRVLPVRLAVLFGSYAKGTYTVASDVDLLVVYAGRPREDVFAVVKKVMALRGLEPHVYSEGEYLAVKPTIDRMIEGGVVLLRDTGNDPDQEGRPPAATAPAG
ncbi:MAG: nucleotidyltransferase domain-containing protein [Dehalococcoidia bacterium]|nr:nucleotidyltransferase domain-containing protein [Dehalococcoidia bacterium]